MLTCITRGCTTGGWNTPLSSASWEIVISVCWQLSLDWLMITPEQTEMDNILNIWQKEFFILSFVNPEKLNISQIYSVLLL